MLSAMALWDEILNPSTLGGIPIPVASRRLTIGRDAARHKLAFRPGQIVEDTGRMPFAIEVEVPLFASLDPSYYPDGYRKIAALLEESETELDFEDPLFGTLTVKAFQVECSESADERDGVRMTLRLEEATPLSDVQFLFAAATDPASAARSAAEELDEALEILGVTGDDVYGSFGDAGFPLGIDERAALTAGDVFLGLTSLLLQVFDGTQVSALVAASAVDTFRARVEAIRNLDVIAQPSGWDVLRATSELTGSMTEVAENNASRTPPILPFIVPFDCSVYELASLLYGDANRVSEILRNNSIRQPLFVAKGTTLRMAASAS